MNLDNAREKVLRESIAQTVYKYLRDIHNNRPEYADRWIWELLQNARDVARDEPAIVSVALRNGTFSFRHNGAPFTEEEVAHLVYSGSSKDDHTTDAEAIGRFGSGFLTTHVLAGTITVVGELNDNGSTHSFHFPLTRNGASADDLIREMDASWQAFKQSITNHHPAPYSTTYEYQLTTDTAAIAARGLSSLARLAPYTLAFNHRIRELRIASDQEDRRLWVPDDPATLADGITLINIKASNGTTTEHAIAIARQDDVTVAIMTNVHEGQHTITPADGTPRLFVAFPLFGTEHFCFPAVLNSEHFAVREKRDGIYLGADTTTAITENKARLATACTLFTKVLQVASEHGWKALHRLAQLPALQPYPWLDATWHGTLLRERVIAPLRTTPIIETSDGTRRTPKDARLPLTRAAYSADDLWALSSPLASIDPTLPVKEDVRAWATAVEQWATLLGVDVTTLPESWTVEKLAKHVAEHGTIDALAKDLAVEVHTWLDQFYALITNASQQALFDNYRLLPDQAGTLHARANLRIDAGIDEQLKDIAATLDLPGRRELLDQTVSPARIPDLPKKTEADLLAQLLDRIKDKPETKATSPTYEEANIALFTWLVANNHHDKLEGYPCLTQDPDDRILRLTKNNERTPLAPPALWPEQARPFADLFPERHTIKSAYYDAHPHDDAWAQLATHRYATTSPVTTTGARDNDLTPTEPLPDGKHGVTQDTNATSIAFLNTKDIGVLNRTRNSKTRAKQFFHFLAEYLATSHPLTKGMAACECGSNHEYYHATWLKGLKENSWVPLGDKKTDKATAETIAALLADEPGFLKQLATGPAALIMRAIGISPSDLLLRIGTKTEEERVQVVAQALDLNEALGNDPAKFQAVVDALKDDPKVLDDIQDAVKKRSTVKRNQGIGKAVEDLLQELLRDTGLTVTRKRIGHDFEIEHDVIDPDSPEEELGWEIKAPTKSFLLEVKASTEYSFRMTPKQAETAVQEGPRFVVCMVQLPSATGITPEHIRNGARFVPAIGTPLTPLWNDYNTLEDLKATVGRTGAEVELIIQDGTTRFKIGRELWEQGLHFEQAIAHFQGNKPENPPTQTE